MWSIRGRLLFATVCFVLMSGAGRASPPSIESEAARQFQLCLRPDPPRLSGPAAASLPPGLSRTGNIAAVRIPTRTGTLYAYRDKSGSEALCGIAVYGTNADAIAGHIRRTAKTERGYSPASPNAYKIEGDAGRHVEYWGDAKAPGLRGIRLVTRRQSAAAPSLEAEVHTGLIR